MDKPHDRRLPLDQERAANQTDHDRLERQARLYTHQRRAIILRLADTVKIGLTPVEVDNVFTYADSKSQGGLEAFQVEAARKIEEIAARAPHRVRSNVLKRWFEEAMDEQTRARMDAADWYDDAWRVYVDVEATGLSEDDVPIEIGMSDRDNNPVMELYLQPLDGKRETVHMSESAVQVTGYQDDDLWQYQPLENYPFDWLKFESMHVVFHAYHAAKDREFICRALKYAVERHPERRDLVDALRYIGKPAHWIDVKDTLTQAIGLNPETVTGRYCKLEDVARATGALVNQMEQEHSALADAKLLAQIVRNIRQEIEHVTAVDEARDTVNEAADTIQRLQARVEELEAQLESVGKRDGAWPHKEARSVCWTDLIVNGYPINFSVREGLTPEEAANELFEHLRALMLIQVDKRVHSFMVGQPTRSQYREMKPGARHEMPAPPPPKDPPANSQPPDQKEQSTPPGKTHTMPCIDIMRGKTKKDTWMYSFNWNLPDGTKAQWPFEVYKPNDVEALEKFLKSSSMDVNQLQPGVTRNLKRRLKISYDEGDFVKGSTEKRYRDNIRYAWMDDEARDEAEPF